MIIISNDCSCYWFYDRLGQKYNHPFISNRQFKDDFINTVKYFKEINWESYKSYPENILSGISGIDPYLRIRVDDKINIHYIHTKYDSGKDDRYKRRISRLQEIINTDPNIIFICNENGDCFDCYPGLKDICVNNGYKLMYCSPRIETKINKNILTINESFRPGELSKFILENDLYKTWLLENE